MKFFLDFFRQKVPRDRGDTPPYYRMALATAEILMAVYFLLCFLLFPLILKRWEWVPLLFIAAMGISLQTLKTKKTRTNLILYTLICAGWVCWNVLNLGWTSGVQHLLTLLVVLVFFDVYEKPVSKILWLIAVLAFRIVLFSVSRDIANLDPNAGTVYQTVNTVSFFLILAAVCIIFSSSIQDTERQLRLKNQTLYKEAGTDQLTGLPNRRALIEQIQHFCQASPGAPFNIAIADIDYFKNINDTYGHNCGDYALVKLAELFVERGMGKYSVCRWGGEEFCFFIPNLNLDEAGVLMNDLCYAVEKLRLEYEDHSFTVTLTIGVEEYDFVSPLDTLIESADEKLYMGKNAGRNRVVV